MIQMAGKRVGDRCHLLIPHLHSHTITINNSINNAFTGSYLFLSHYSLKLSRPFYQCFSLPYSPFPTQSLHLSLSFSLLFSLSITFSTCDVRGLCSFLLQNSTSHLFDEQRGGDKRIVLFSSLITFVNINKIRFDPCQATEALFIFLRMRIKLCSEQRLVHFYLFIYFNACMFKKRV